MTFSINDKQIQLLLVIDKSRFIRARDKNKIYCKYEATHRALQTLFKKGLVDKNNNELNEKVYTLSIKGNNLLCVLGFKSYKYFSLDVEI